MILLFDENLSSRLTGLLSSDFPDSRHVEAEGLKARPDREIWEFAGAKAWVIVSKDNDFRQLAFLLGAPPKVVQLRVGNAGTVRIAALLRGSRSRIEQFAADPEESLLVLSLG